MKHYLVLLILVASIINFPIQASSSIQETDALDKADICLTETIELMYEDEIFDNYSISRKELFDHELNAIGYVYSIINNNIEGYAIVVNSVLYYEVTELFLEKESPFKNISGQPIYLTLMSYIEFKDGKFYDLSTNSELSNADIAYLVRRGYKYRGGTYSRSETRIVNYTDKSVDSFSITNSTPNYFNTNSVSLSNTCAVNAGSVVIGYWGRYYPELVPGHKVGRNLGASYYYFPQSPAVQTLIEDLYHRMGTNIGQPGTTAAGCMNGLTNYVKSKNLNISYSSVVNNAVLNYTSYMNQLSLKKPILLFLNTYNLLGENYIVQDNQKDTITIDYYTGLHVVVGFGYRTIKYYSGANNFRTDKYLKVYTGFSDMLNGYVKLDDNIIIQEGYSIEIF